ncbi:MAG: magnesium-translocating P-type ATPase, partial [Erysipelotrichaceae bacterium]|nr:magnesium-translocating P-type ATPase [Erysipelotrichaceae bacterium]
MNQENQKTNDALLVAAKSPVSEVLKSYNQSETGYNESQVTNSRNTHGRNEIIHKNKNTIFRRVFASFINPFVLILIALAVVSLFTDVIFAKPGSKDPATAIIIFIMVSISGLLKFFQENKSFNAANKLKSLIQNTASVIRDGTAIEVPFKEIVVGDIITLAAGDMLPADVRIIQHKDLFISEAALTGESHPSEKLAESLQFEHQNPLELNNLAFMGSNVISGSGHAIVLEVGNETLFGRISKNLTEKRVPTAFEKGVNATSWLLIRFMCIMVPIIFVINGLFKNFIFHLDPQEAWLNSLLFALAVAVGLTPEMLPMIVTTGLGKGSVNMAKHKAIVKNIDSIQNFGSIDILCTDKTGTLTQDQIVLEQYLDVLGHPSTRVLRHAILNSYFQTGVKNVMDLAILKHIDDEEIKDAIKNYQKVDEIPFDFVRRRMSVVTKDLKGVTQLITKGAAEEILDICKYASYETVVEITPELQSKIDKALEKLSKDGFRILAVAEKHHPPVAGLFTAKDENEMVLIGFLAFLDPPKDSAKAAIKALKERGVLVKVLTGDALTVTQHVCKEVGISAKKALVGSEIALMSDAELESVIDDITIFAKLNPEQKKRVVTCLKNKGHVVGFMGDGINDAPALRAADVGISVDTAVDIAKESADIILLEKSLMILEQGIIEGRKTYANIIKYIKMAASSNFGNVFSLIFAAALLPFLPMLPIQILILNLIHDITCIAMPWDNVDPDYILHPRKWEAKGIGRFMLWFGPVSSIFDLTTYALMFFVICPVLVGLPSGMAFFSASATD